MLQPIALEMLGSINKSATHHLEDLGRKIVAISNDTTYKFGAPQNTCQNLVTINQVNSEIRR